MKNNCQAAYDNKQWKEYLLKNGLISPEKEKKKNPAGRKRNHPDNNFISQLISALNVLGIRTRQEYQFSKRLFRFDLIITTYNKIELLKSGIKIAVEYEGGIFSNGRHTRGRGYAKDCVKYNLAQILGWTVLRYTPLSAKSRNWEFRIADEIRRLTESRLQNIKENKNE